jgi:hypothetical protein
MKKVKWIVFNSLVLFLFLPGILSAEEIGILPFRTIGVESYIEDDLYDLLESELDYFDHKVVSPYEIEHYLGRRVICYNKDYAADYGSSLGLEKVIFGSITRIGEKYVISVEVVKSRTGEVLFYDKTTLENEEYLDDYAYSLAEAIEEDVYGNVVYYSPTYSRTITHVYVGNCWRPRIIWRIPRRRSLITVRLPLININLGKSHHIVNRTPTPRKPVYVKTSPKKHDNHANPSKGKSAHGKQNKGKSGQEKQKNEKHHGNDGGSKKGRR